MIFGFGFSGDKDFFARAGATLDNVVFLVFSFVGTVLLSIGCAFVGSYDNTAEYGKVNSAYTFFMFLLSNPWIWILLAILFFGFGMLGSYLDQKKIAADNLTLKKEKEAVDELNKKIDASQEEGQVLRSRIQKMHQKLVESWLKGVSKQIGLCTHTRVSIYYEHDEDFYLLARYSANPALAKIHKLKFGLNQGVISQAWKHGIHVDDKSPEYADNPANYIKYMSENYGYSEEQLESINMKSCRFYGIAIREADENIGVILFESESSNTLDKDAREKIENYCNDYQSHLSGFVRDGLSFDKSAANQTASNKLNIEAEFIKILGQGNK